MIYGKDNSTRENAKVATNAIEKIERIRVSTEVEEESLNFEGVQDDLDDSMSIQYAPKKQPTTSNSSLRKNRRIEHLEQSGEPFK